MSELKKEEERVVDIRVSQGDFLDGIAACCFFLSMNYEETNA